MPFLLLGVVWAFGMVALAVTTAERALLNARDSRGRWGEVLRVHAPERGPYREALATERVPRRAPLSVWATAALGPAWASLVFLFAPMGAFFLVGASCEDIWGRPCDLPRAVHLSFVLGAIALAVSSLVLAVRLIRDSVALPTGGAAELHANRITAVFGVVHHAIVLAWWAVSRGVHGDLDAIPLVGIPCAIGVLVALLQLRASSDVARALASAGAEDAEAAGGEAQ